jgi:hypothetical protein
MDTELQLFIGFLIFIGLALLFTVWLMHRTRSHLDELYPKNAPSSDEPPPSMFDHPDHPDAPDNPEKDLT